MGGRGVVMEHSAWFVSRWDSKKARYPVGFLLWKSDNLVAEGYYAPVKRNDLHRMFSVTKSFVSIAIGLLQEECRLTLDDPIVKFFPEYVPDPAQAHPWLLATTIRDMLSMRSCHATTTYDKFSSKTDWVASFFEKPISSRTFFLR